MTPVPLISSPVSLKTLLGGLSVKQFLVKHWQKKPLLVRQAVPGFKGLLSRDALLQLACHDEVEARFVSAGNATRAWTCEHGPFKLARFRRAKKPWTALVQGLNLHHPAAEQLLRAFSFIPYARLDDLMVSYATDGGGVGPHFDNYDVFLLQGMGERRWRIGNQRDTTCIEGLPLRILKNFRPTQEWVLQPGDMLYLPPQWAHDGVAVGECMTYSIGFRTFPAQEIAEQFLLFMAEQVELPGRYADPGLQPQKHPAQIGADMVEQCARILSRIRWNQALVEKFLGRLFTEPKSQVVFSRPARPPGRAQFETEACRKGVTLDAKSQLLYRGAHFFINGEEVAVSPADRPTLRRLADRRRLDALSGLSAAGIDLLHDWRCCGFLAAPRATPNRVS